MRTCYLLLMLGMVGLGFGQVGDINHHPDCKGHTWPMLEKDGMFHCRSVNIYSPPLQTLDKVFAEMRTQNKATKQEISLTNSVGETIAVISDDHKITITDGHTADEVILLLLDENLRQTRSQKP